MDRAAVEPAREYIQQIGAVKRVIGRAVALGQFETIVELEKLAGLHVAGVHAWRAVADGGDLVAQADRPQRLDGLRAGIDRGADLAELRRRLEHVSGDTKMLQRIRGRKSGQPAADDRNPDVCCQCPLRSVFGLFTQAGTSKPPSPAPDRSAR